MGVRGGNHVVKFHEREIRAHYVLVNCLASHLMAILA